MVGRIIGDCAASIMGEGEKKDPPLLMLDMVEGTTGDSDGVRVGGAKKGPPLLLLMLGTVDETTGDTDGVRVGGAGVRAGVEGVASETTIAGRRFNPGDSELGTV